MFPIHPSHRDRQHIDWYMNDRRQCASPKVAFDRIEMVFAEFGDGIEVALCILHAMT